MRARRRRLARQRRRLTPIYWMGVSAGQAKAWPAYPDDPSGYAAYEAGFWDGYYGVVWAEYQSGLR